MMWLVQGDNTMSVLRTDLKESGLGHAQVHQETERARQVTSTDRAEEEQIAAVGYMSRLLQMQITVIIIIC